MGERLDLPRVQSTTAPTPLNHTTARYAFFGDMAAGLIANLVFPASALLHTGLGIAGLIIGAKWGAKVGMAKQERELTEGRVVHEPTYWNKGILSGLVVGGAISTALSLVATTLTALSLPAIGTGAGILAITGAVIGSIAQHAHLKRDYDHAIAGRNMQYAQARQQAQAQGLGIGQYMNSVSPEESQALAAKQEIRTSDMSHAALLDQAAEVPQQPQR